MLGLFERSVQRVVTDRHRTLPSHAGETGEPVALERLLAEDHFLACEPAGAQVCEDVLEAIGVTSVWIGGMLGDERIIDEREHLGAQTLREAGADETRPIALLASVTRHRRSTL